MKIQFISVLVALFYRELLFLDGIEPVDCAGGAGGRKVSGLCFSQGKVCNSQGTLSCHGSGRLGTPVFLSAIQPEAKSSLPSLLADK